ncbi:MAG: malto-oligosyltrehalose trehalohydrolase [Ilumatobacteraceae bacterium]
MSNVRVWAPAVSVIELVTPDDRIALVAAGGGWWESAVALPAGTRYRFAIGGELLADPRSGRQPDGPQGWSQTVDHNAFAWHDSAWAGFPLAAAVIYELHVGTFSAEGTFDGVIGKLDELVALGITVVELMPVATFPGSRGWGYDGVNLFAPQETYGGPDGLKRLVDECHRRQLAVVLDVVYNHLGPVGNSLGRFGPYFTDAYRTPWGEAVNLDGPGSDEVRRLIIDNALMWILDYHVDGLRLDAVHAFHDASAVHILEQLGDEVHAVGRRTGRTVWVVAESDLNDPQLVRSSEAHGYGLDATWSDDFHHALHVTLTGERSGYYSDFEGVDDLADAIANVYVFRGRFAPTRGRTHGRSVGDMDRSRFVCFAQNHDQIGNRATGERLAHLLSPARTEIAAALLLTMPFVPMLFQGEEWAASSPFQYFTDIDDEEVGSAVREGRRAEFAAFGWTPEQVPDPQAYETFVRSRLNWEERSAPEHSRLLSWYKQLIALRAQHPTLRDGRAACTAVHHASGSGVLVIDRDEQSIVVNLSEQQATVPVRPVVEVMLTNDAGIRVVERAAADEVVLAADRIAVIRHRSPSGDCLQLHT